MLESDEDDSGCLSPNNAFSYLMKNNTTRLKDPNFESVRSLNNPGMYNNLPRNFENQRGPDRFLVSYGSTSDRLPHREYGHDLMPPPHKVHESFYNRGYANMRHGSPTRSMISKGGRRLTSPISYRSTSDRLPQRQYGHSLMPPPHNTHQSFYNGSYAHSYANGRPGSPTMSMMSMESNKSVMNFIVSEFKSRKFNKYELRNIKEAYQKHIKGCVRKRITKKRNLKKFLKGSRRISGGESGEQGSDSSLSSDDRRSTRTGVTLNGGYTNYASSSKYQRSGRNSDDARSVQTDITDLKKILRDNDRYKDRSREIKQSSLRNMCSLGSRQMNNTSIARSNYSIGPAHSTTINTTLRDRFKNSVLLPSQRFKSDDRRSTRTGVTLNGGYTNYASSSKYQRSGRNSDDARSVQTDITDLKKILRDNDRYKDRSREIKQSSLRNMCSLGSRQMNNTSIARSNYSIGPAHSTTINTTLRDRFKNSVLLPSQRFNNSTAQPIIEENNVSKQIGTRILIPNTQKERFKGSFLLPSQSYYNNTTIPHLREHQDDIVVEKNSRAKSPILRAKNHKQKRTCQDLSSSSEENHNDVTVLEKTTNGKKPTRKSMMKTNLKSSDELLPPRNKATKHTTPKKVANKVKNTSKIFETYCNNDKEQSDFSFAKPTLPLKKPAANKVANSKRDRNLNPEVLKPANRDVNCVPKSKEGITEKHDACKDPSDSAFYTSDMSMRPSFIKRKLFTQTLEVTESKNLSTDSSPSSPHKQKRQCKNAQNEKNKTRKLVPSSSYMSRDVADDSNLLDLIHKIVPLDRMNITQQKPQNKPNLDNKQKETDDEKWDISSIINIKDVDAGSDTFTNEDIFDTNDSDFIVRPRKVTKNSPPRKMIRNSPPKKMVKNCPPKKMVENSPPKKMVKNSPPRKMVESLPPKKMVKNSPPKEMVKNSPPKKIAKNSPPKNVAKILQIQLQRIEKAENNERKKPVTNKLNNAPGKNVESAQTSQKTSRDTDDPIRSVLYYANKFWNCDSESDDPVTPNRSTRLRRSKALINDSYSKSLPQRNSHAKKINTNTSEDKENRMIVNGKPKPAKNALKPVANKPTTRNNVNLNDSQKTTIRIPRKNNVKKVLQDKSITPTRQSPRLKLKVGQS